MQSIHLSNFVVCNRILEQVEIAKYIKMVQLNLGAAIETVCQVQYT